MTIFDIFRRPPSAGPTVREARELINYELAADRYRRAQLDRRLRAGGGVS